MDYIHRIITEGFDRFLLPRLVNRSLTLYMAGRDEGELLLAMLADEETRTEPFSERTRLLIHWEAVRELIRQTKVLDAQGIGCRDVLREQLPEYWDTYHSTNWG